MPSKREVDVARAVEQLLDEALERHTTAGEDPETFIQCHMCNQWEDHADGCPVPALQKWLDQPWPSERQGG